MNSSAVMLLYRGGDGGFVPPESIAIGHGPYTLVDAAAPRGLKKQDTKTRGGAPASTATTGCSTLLNLSLDMS